MDKNTERNVSPEITRRQFTIGACGTAALFGIGGLGFAFPGTTPCRPPGGQDEIGLLAACIHCDKCQEACPTHAISMAGINMGLSKSRTPIMNFKRGYCDFCEESNGGIPKCVQVCPTHALTLPQGANAQNTLIGVAKVTNDWCLSFRNMTCRECFEACPFEAIEIDEYSRPTIISDKCNGCGICEFVCISMISGSLALGATDRAITIKPIDRA